MTKKIKAKLIRTKKGYVTDMIELIDRFLDSDDDYAEWVNYPHKNAYVCQIAVIVRTKDYGKTCVKACKRKEVIYLVKKDKMSNFIEEIGF